MYTKEEFIEAVKTSYSIAEVLRKLTRKPVGGNYKIVKFNIRKYNLDTSHFTGQGHLKGKSHNWSPKIPDDKIFVKNGEHNLASVKIKKRLFDGKYLEKKCYKCENTTWQGQSIALELEHINGDNEDNRIENLTVLCPNCHAQTTTYRGKNQQRIKFKNNMDA